MDKGYLEDLAIMAVSTDRRGIDRKRWRATRRTVLERDQYRCRKDELAAGVQGGPLPGGGVIVGVDWAGLVSWFAFWVGLRDI